MDSLRKLLDGLSVGVACTDRTGKVLVWNRAMEEMTRIHTDAIVGHSLSHCFPQLQEIVADVTPDGEPKVAHASLRPQPMQAGHPNAGDGGSVVEFEATIRDCEPELEALSGWHRLWTFQPRHRQLEQAHADFVATVSHELRTPLTSIKGFVDTLLQCHSQLSDAQEERFLRIVKAQADRLIHMVEDVLLVSRLQSGQLRNSPQQLALQDACDRVISSFPPPQQDRIHYEFSPGLPTVWADPERLDQILKNLLDNALRYSDDDSEVLIQAGLHVSDPNRVAIAIVDRGVGMDKAQLAQIFNRFNHTDNPMTRATDGTGLGLYITKSLIECFGGHIEMESEVGRGTTCHIDLPSAPGIRWRPPSEETGSSEPVPEWANFLL